MQINPERQIIPGVQTNHGMQMNAIHADLTRHKADAIVNAANSGLRGGGGVDGAIHSAGGPEIVRECIEKYPSGLPTGQVGITTAGNLPATWVLHAVGPNHGARQKDPALLASCYTNALALADSVGAKHVAFPLISAGIYRWPLEDAVRIAVSSVRSATTSVDRVDFVALDKHICALIQQEIAGA